MKKRLVSFSTGNFYVQGRLRDKNKDISLCSKLKGIDGVEIMFALGAYLRGFKLKKSNIKFLRSLKFNTLHAPIWIKNSPRGKYYYNTLYCKKILNKLHKIYDQIEAKNINFHAYQIKNFNLFKNKDYQYSIENLEARHNMKLSRYKEILNNHPNFKMVLDTSHCQEVDEYEIKRLVKMFKRKIMYTHLSSNTYNKIHQPIHTVDKKFLKQLNPVKGLRTPIVIETWTNTIDIKMMNKEIRFVKKWAK